MIWKLDRLGRSLKHLIEIVNGLMQHEVGLKSLNDPIDTTTPQGRLVFKLFAARRVAQQVIYLAEALPMRTCCGSRSAPGASHS